MSNINYLSINENFPVPGQDNDTQVFRDNFDTIKQSLRIAGAEITDLQDNVARTDLDSDFNGKTVQNAVLLNTVNSKIDRGELSGTVTVDYEDGNYQIIKLTGDASIQFLNLPSDTIFEGRGVGRITLELYGNNVTRAITFISNNGTVIKKDPKFPTALTVTSSTNPLFIEVWQHEQNVLFMEYISNYDLTLDPDAAIVDINEIGNVTITSPANNQVLKFDSTSSKWINGTFTTSISSASDVTITSLANNQVLKYDTATSKWINAAFPISISSASDATITSPANNQVLKYDTATSKWINGTLAIINASDVLVSNVKNNDLLVYSTSQSAWINYSDVVSYAVSVTDTAPTQDFFTIDGTNVAVDSLKFRKGTTYRFDLSNSENSRAPLRFSTQPDTTQAAAAAANYADGVTIVGTAGTAGAYIELKVTETTPSVLYLYGASSGTMVSKNGLGGGFGYDIINQDFYTGKEDLADGSTVSLTKSVSYFTTSGVDSAAETATLNDGTEGQVKVFAMVDNGGPMIITVTSPGWGGNGQIVFTQTGSGCTLQYINSKWYCIGNNGAEFS